MSKICKTCDKPLPKGYKYDKCESCRNKEAHGFKKGLKIVGGLVVTIVGGILLNGKSGKK